MMHFERLEQFIGGYFHQDWDIEGESDKEVVLSFKRDNTLKDINLLIIDISEVLSKKTESELCILLNKMGCEYYYQADGKSAKEWLKHLQMILSGYISV